MTTYTIQGPSGKSYTIEGPEGATADQLGQVILANSHDERVAATTEQMRREYAPTVGMDTTDRVRAGIGRGMTSVYRAVSQLNPFGGTTQDDVNEARRLDAPLLDTTAGKVGNTAGMVAATLPTMFIPGANTMAGAALVGAGTGALTTEGGVGDRLRGAIGGAEGGMLGKAGGEFLGEGANALRRVMAAKAAANATANAGRDAATAAAQGAGYVVTPSMSGNPGVIGGAAEALGGKIKTQQAASVRNQQLTNNLAARELGLPEGIPITQEALDALRAKAGGAYRDVASMGQLDAAGANLPASTGATTSLNKLTMAPETKANASQVVQAWRQANADAAAYMRAYGRDANPETLAKAHAASADADAITEFLTNALAKEEARTPQQLTSQLARGLITPQEYVARALRNMMTQSGQLPPAAQALKDARVLIAKSHSVEGALNPITGDVSAPALAAQMAKGKPLSGGLETAANFATAFPKAAQPGVDVPTYSVMDAMATAGAGAAGAATGNPLAAAAGLFPVLRPVARSVALSGPVQRGLAPSYQVNPFLQGGAKALVDPRVRALEQLFGTSMGVQAPQQQALQR